MNTIVAGQLDFINTEELGVRDIEDVDERVVEQEIIHNIKRFMMTFGKDFAFVGNQYNLKDFGKEHFPDMPEQFRKALPDVEEMRKLL